MASLPSAEPFAILIVSEGAGTESLIKERLKICEGWDLRVERARTGEQALQKLKTFFYDLVFVDADLADFTNLEFLSRLRQSFPKSGVVVTSAKGSHQEASRALKSGALDYLSHEDISEADFVVLFKRILELKELMGQNVELRQISHMKSEFIANISHDLRAPLSVIIGYAQTLCGATLGEMNAEQRRAVETIAARAEELLKRLNQILLFRESESARHQLALKPLEISAFLSRQTAHRWPEIEKKRLHLEWNVPGGEVWTLADEASLAEVLENLISNAAKFSPPEGAVRLSLRVDGDKVVLSVRDQGPGIPSEMLPYIFEGFSAAGKTQNTEIVGLGIGLALSRRIIEEHGGALWLSSNEGQGTVAEFSLPLAPKDSSGRTLGAPLLIEKRRILLVDDNPDILELALLFLGAISHNLEIQTARSGHEALEAVKHQIPHLMVLDIMMPGMNGVELIERLRRSDATRDIPILVMTGHLEAIPLAKAAGAQEVLPKPFERREFVEKVVRLLRLQQKTPAS